MALQTYCVQIVEPSTGKLRILCLYDGISEAELTSIYSASFETSASTVGFTDEKGVHYPFSLLWKSPKVFTGSKLVAVTEGHSPSQSSKELLGYDSESTLLTEDHVRKVFNQLDLNHDRVVHKEEFIEVATRAYDRLLEAEPGLSFAYQMLSPSELAVATVTSCYKAQSEDEYYLEYDDFYAWFISSGFDPLRELLSRAMGPHPHPTATLRRSKSTPALNIHELYSDSKISSFMSSARDALGLRDSQAALFRDLQAHARSRSASRHAVISRDQLIALLLKHSPDPSSAMIRRVLEVVLEILRIEAGSVPLGHAVSLLAFISGRCDRTTFDAIFQCYETGPLASDIMFYVHVFMAVRLIFYFNSSLANAAGCTAEELAHGVYVKVLLCAEVSRRAWGKLSLEELVEVFAHGLRIALSALRIRSGYFTDMLNSIVGYASAPLSPLEDDQVASLFVGYGGAAVTIAEARDALGLYEYTSFDIVKYIAALGGEDGRIGHLSYQRGVLRLIAEHYVALPVLDRSVADFVLDRLLLVLDGAESGSFSVLDLCIALQLFCDDDDYDRGTVLLAMVRNKALRFGLVVQVAEVLFKTCYALNPWAGTEDYLTQAKADATAFVMECYMAQDRSEGFSGSASAFTNAQFVNMINNLLAYLAVVSEQRRDVSADGTEAKEQEEEDGDEDNRDGEGVQSFSDDEDEDDANPFLDDEQFPPSSTVLELRAAACMLGLEGYRPDDLIDQLGGLCHAGRLNAKGWARWFGSTLQASLVMEQDLDMAMHLGNQVFAAFASSDKEAVDFASICPGLAMLCADAPLEDRLMVAFTVVDADSDGFIAFTELVTLIQSVLTMVVMCSRMASRRIIALGVSLNELSMAAAKEGYHAASLREDEDLSLETFCDLADDFLKLASVV